MKGRMCRILTVSMVSLLCFSMVLPASAATKEETQKKINQLEKEKSELESKLSDLKKNKTSTEDYIEQLDAQLNDINADIEEINTSLEDIGDEIDETEKNLKEAKKKEAQQYEVLKLRIKHMYEQGQMTYLDVLFNASDIDTFLNSAEYIAQISEFDEQLLSSLIETSNQIDTYEQELKDKKAEMETKKTELEGKQEEVNQVTEAKKEELSSINESIDGTESDISDVQEDLNNESEVLAALEAAEAEAKRQYEALKQQEEAKKAEAEAAKKKAQQEAEAAKKAAEEAARVEAEKQAAAQKAAEEAAKAEEAKKAEAEAAAQKAKEEAEKAAAEKAEADKNAAEAQDKAESENQNSGIATGTGSMTWPLPGYTSISSPFGSRICPFHGPENHDGVDIPAPGGTPIHAADSGVVVAAKYHYSLGNYIIINHGNGVQTYYLHTSAMYVSVGTKVNKGDVIAAVGTTGSSTGNHLDFRVNVNGSYVNPTSYATPY